MRPAHYMIQVRDLGGAVGFYQRVLGMLEVDRHRYDGATLAYLRGDDSAFEIELLSPDNWTFMAEPEAGRTHIAFAVDDIEAEQERLRNLGIAIDPVSDYVANGTHQTRYFYFCDPEGNQIEFLEASGRYAGNRS